MIFNQTIKRMAQNQRLINGVLVGLGLALYIAMGMWGGVPPQSNLGFFVAGLVVMMLVIIALGLAGWHLLFRPLPAEAQAAVIPSIPAAIRYSLATMLSVSGSFFVVGGFWDEVWHRTYGLPFGEDLFWRPHLMMYAGILVVIGLSLVGLFYIVRAGQGTLQQRFQASPLLGLAVFVGVFMVYVLPADPIWHFIYGEDITGWSIPHINILFSFLSALMLAIMIYVTTQPVRSWDMRLQAAWLPIFVSALMLNLALLGMTTDWDHASVTVLQTRPDWLLPATIVVFATLVGTMVSHVTRFIGAGTVMGLVALGIRLSLRWGFDFYGATANAWVLALFPLMAIDVARFIHLLWRKRPPAWPVTGLAAAMGLALAFPLLNQYFRHPQIGMDNLFPTLLATSIAACGAAWVGQRLGDYAATANKQGQDVLETAEGTLRYVPAVAFVAVIGFIVFFIATATPPA